MIISTALLIRERGARATSIDAILEHSGASRGSVRHYFPGGREQLLREATGFSEEYVARRLERAGVNGALAAIDGLYEHYCETLRVTKFRGGCPVVAVAIEVPEEGPGLRDAAAAAFERWQSVLARPFETEGIGSVRARELATLILAAFEGALILARTARDLAPLQTAHRELRELVRSEIATSRGQPRERRDPPPASPTNNTE
ncbi:MAG: TetR/AcrR family transcriptional regulator [Solirubrobacteraceae bacterium]